MMAHLRIVRYHTRLLVLGTVLTIITGCSNDATQLSSARFVNLTVYDADGFVDAPQTVASKVSSFECDANVIGPLLRRATRKEDPLVWKATRLIRIELDDGTFVYGAIGFGPNDFKVHGQSGVFTIPKPSYAEWQELIEEAFEKSLRRRV